MKLHEAADLVNEMAEEFKDSGGVPSSLLGMDDIALPDAATRMSEAVQMVDQFVYRLKKAENEPDDDSRLSALRTVWALAELKYEQTKDKKLTGKSQTVIENALAFVWQMIEEVEALKNDADRVAYATEVLDELGVKMPHVCKVLEVSTAHITQVTAERLGDEGDKFCIREDHGGYGWWVYVESDKTEASDSDDLLPDDLKTVIQYARSLGCLWLVLDQDVDPIDDLPEHEW